MENITQVIFPIPELNLTEMSDLVIILISFFFSAIYEGQVTCLIYKFKEKIYGITILKTHPFLLSLCFEI